MQGWCSPAVCCLNVCLLNAFRDGLRGHMYNKGGTASCVPHSFGKLKSKLILCWVCQVVGPSWSSSAEEEKNFFSPPLQSSAYVGGGNTTCMHGCMLLGHVVCDCASVRQCECVHVYWRERARLWYTSSGNAFKPIFGGNQWFQSPAIPTDWKELVWHDMDGRCGWQM